MSNAINHTALAKRTTLTATYIMLVSITSLFFVVNAQPGQGPGSGPISAPVFEADLPEQPLFIPPILEPTSIDSEGYQVYDLAIQSGTHEFVPSVKSATYGYNGNFLGPTLRVAKGDLVRFNITNNIQEVSTVHWHGFHVPPEMDGTPHQQIEVGETWQPYFEIKNEATMMWYHPHTHGATATQAYAGLAGLFYIEDENSKSLDLPNIYGVNDIPVIVQDKMFTDEGEMVYQGGNGQIIAANGVLNAYVEVEGSLIRFRLLNGSNKRFYNFGFSDDRDFYQIGTDGGFLESPVTINRVLLSPGERADIVVDLSDDTDVTLRTYGHEDAAWEINDKMDVLNIKVNPTNIEVKSLPQVLNDITSWTDEEVDRIRPIVLGGTILDDPTNVYSDNGPKPFPINGMLMHMARVDEVVTLGDVEIWEVSNASHEPHPFHVHDVQFLVLDRDGSPPAANEYGWKDTVPVKANETVRIIAQYTDFANEDVPFMFHCHIMEHEDAGMMGQFTVVTPDSHYVNSDGYMLDIEMDHSMDMDGSNSTNHSIEMNDTSE